MIHISTEKVAIKYCRTRRLKKFHKLILLLTNNRSREIEQWGHSEFMAQKLRLSDSVNQMYLSVRTINIFSMLNQITNPKSKIMLFMSRFQRFCRQPKLNKKYSSLWILAWSLIQVCKRFSNKMLPTLLV